ncbi:hypothetical protein SAMN05192529_11277 [Arachidicoccus rhizosphaerae]|uniref:Uncharacterized protein n=1 Tax=Arachidicoccus rhizosphaerae TaxID=551991 RepID=A0A1H3ZW74_9BACT|nr:hypothetical protein [Arachidicoccus rhizosphaerae]SEA27993.1 hypothetical protein SAMN05192529_11277 [Arachidicoccus rhizosphaerae]
MSTRRFDVLLDDKKIGWTFLENADAPMGVVTGRIYFIDIDSGYGFLKAYCEEHCIEIITENPDQQLIATSAMAPLSVVSPEGIEIKGQSVNIEGMDQDYFEIFILGIPYPFFEQQFGHHVNKYRGE